jgi:tyrosine-protein phosphatase SIW14
MRYVNVPMRAIGAPPDEDVAKVLALFDLTTDGPVLVHCRRGSDRTGTVIACYRITHDHWQNQDALKEAKSYGMSWAEPGMMRYIMHFRLGAQPVADRP